MQTESCPIEKSSPHPSLPFQGWLFIAQPTTSILDTRPDRHPQPETGAVRNHGPPTPAAAAAAAPAVLEQHWSRVGSEGNESCSKIIPYYGATVMYCYYSYDMAVTLDMFLHNVA